MGMEFFCYHRDRPGSVALRDELLEQHWAYMDQYAKTMIARGPTFADDGDTPTGSVHIVDLPDPVTVRAFALPSSNAPARKQPRARLSSNATRRSTTRSRPRPANCKAPTHRSPPN
jgi:uncharacterized protein YciI